MNVTPTTPSQSSSPAAASRPGQAQGQGFNSFLTKASSDAEARGLSRSGQARRAADQLVSSALLKPLFEQMRNSPFKVERFHGGQGEKAFMEQLHTVLGDRITSSANFSVGDAIYEKVAQSPDIPSQRERQEVDVHG